MRAALNDVAFVQHQDGVGVFKGEQPLGDNEGGTPFHQHIQCLLDEMLGLGVHAAGGVIEDEDAGVGEQGAGDGDALFLPTREGDTPFPHAGFVPFGHVGDEFVGAGGFGGFNNVVETGVRPAVGDILGNGLAKQKWVLQHNANVSAQALQLEGADVVVVNGNTAVCGIIKAGNQICHRRLPRTRWPNQRNALPWLHRKANIVQNLNAVAVGKAHLVKRHFPGHLR